jgi:hypothetical protein
MPYIVKTLPKQQSSCPCSLYLLSLSVKVVSLAQKDQFGPFGGGRVVVIATFIFLVYQLLNKLDFLPTNNAILWIGF